MLLVTCAGCGKKLNVKDEFAGKKLKCPACGLVFTPSTGPAPVAAVPSNPVPAPSPADVFSELGEVASPVAGRADRPAAKRTGAATARTGRAAAGDEGLAGRSWFLPVSVAAALLVVGGLGGGVYYFSRGEQPSDKDSQAQHSPKASTPASSKTEKPEPPQPAKDDGTVEVIAGGPDNAPAVVDARTEEMLLGKWRCLEFGGSMIYEFLKNGQVAVYPASGKGPRKNGRYRIVNDQTLEMSGLAEQSGAMEMLLTEDELELTVTTNKDQVQVGGTGKDVVKVEPITLTLHFRRADKEPAGPTGPGSVGIPIPPSPPAGGTDPRPPVNPVPPVVRPPSGVSRYPDLIVGKWTRDNVTYEFTADRRFLVEGLELFQGTYQFQDDRTIRINAAPGKAAAAFTGFWKVSVTSQTLRMYRPDEKRVTRVPLFRRVKAPGDPVVVGNPRPVPVRPVQPEVPGQPWPRIQSAASGKKLQVLEELQIDNKEPVNCVALRPDAKLLAACWDRVHLWDLTVDPPRERATLQAHFFLTRSVAFSPDGKLLATGGGNRMVRLWDVSGPVPVDLGELKSHLGAVNAVAFSPDGKLLASGSDDKTVILWDVSTKPPREAGVLRMADPLSRSVQAVAFAPNSKKLATAGEGHWQIWDVAKKQVTLRGTLNVKAREMPLAFSPDGNSLAMGGDSGIKIGPTRSGAVLLGHAAKVRSVAFTADGKYLASAGEDGRLVLWDLATNKKVLVKDMAGKLNGAAFPQVQAVPALGPDQFLACGNQNGSVVVLHLGYAQEEVVAEPKKPAASDSKPPDDPAKIEAEAKRKLKLIKQMVEDSKEERRKQNLTGANALSQKAKDACEKLIKDFPQTKAAAEAQEIMENLR